MKVSVIIPMYNAEKYLSVCLESLLIQTMKDFEVIVVDDCSTDASLAIAESYLEKFNGRLKIISLPENTGTPGLPRNVGLEFASGKYVFFMDADDLIIDIAMEELFNVSENYQADVVYMDCGFICYEEPVPKDLNEAVWEPNNSVKEPTFEPKNISLRVEKFLARQYKWPPWGKFLRRDFLIDNNIKFPRMQTCEDGIWTFELICLAKRFLRIPEPLYVQRRNEISMTRRNRTPEREIIFRTSPLITGLEVLNEFMCGLEFFKKNPNFKLRVLIFFVDIQIEEMEKVLEYLKPTELYEIILCEFSKAKSTQPALTACLIVMTNIYRQTLKARDNS